MKKSIILSIAAAAAFATAAFTANTVSAADTDSTEATTSTPTYTNNVKDGKTQATITLKPTTDTGDVNGKELGITLDKAPNIDFGTQVLKAAGATYSTSTFDNPLQVTNNGYAVAWNVNVAVSKFTSTTSATTLQGAQLSFDKGDVAAAVEKNGNDGNQSNAPLASGLDAGSASADIFTASATDGTQGVGTWTDTFTNASLKVPAGNVAGTYSADLTWTLSADPTSEAK